MILEIKLKGKTTKCINGCPLFNDSNDYSYWERRKETDDEKHIVSFINKYYLNKKKKILHIGIGNSFVARNLKDYEHIDGISISSNEITKAKLIKIRNYNTFFLNKYSVNNLFENKLNGYDIIIDANLKSFSCCNIAFRHLFSKYAKMLNHKGIIISSKKGMNWSRIIKPIYSFSLKKLFYRRLKEFDGPKDNLLDNNECIALSKKNYLNFISNNENIVYFQNTGK